MPLESMATQLQDVIQKMARVNKNLQNITDDSDAVSQVAKLWRESYQIANEIGRKADDKSEQQSQQPQSSLLIYDRSV